MRYLYPAHMINQQHKKGGYWLTMSERLTVRLSDVSKSFKKLLFILRQRRKWISLLLITNRIEDMHDRGRRVIMATPFNTIKVIMAAPFNTLKVY